MLNIGIKQSWVSMNWSFVGMERVDMGIDSCNYVGTV